MPCHKLLSEATLTQGILWLRKQAYVYFQFEMSLSGTQFVPLNEIISLRKQCVFPETMSLTLNNPQSLLSTVNLKKIKKQSHLNGKVCE